MSEPEPRGWRLRCGISRPTLRKWWRLYRNEGEGGLRDHCRGSRQSLARQIGQAEEERIISLRRTRKQGIKQLRNELLRLDGPRLANDTIHKVLCRDGPKRLKRPRPIRKTGGKRYTRPIPGDRVQMDVCKIAPGLYQYTAINDCSRCHVLAVLPHKSAQSTLTFLDQVVGAMPFSTQHIQTDRGQEFFPDKVQEKPRDWRIKSRPIGQRSPHLDGKAERVEKTALEEFWPAVDLEDPQLDDRLNEWQHL